MTFGESVSTCFRKYADFSVRASRSEYWWFTLFQWLILDALLLPIFLLAVSGSHWAANALAVLYGVCWLGMILPQLAVLVRRLHDTDHSGWYWFVSLIPVVGGIVLLVALASPGTAGENRFNLDRSGRSATGPAA